MALQRQGALVSGIVQLLGRVRSISGSDPRLDDRTTQSIGIDIDVIHRYAISSSLHCERGSSASVYRGLHTHTHIVSVCMRMYVCAKTNT